MSPFSELLLLEHVTGREMTCFLSNSCGSECPANINELIVALMSNVFAACVCVCVLVCYSSELIKHFS